MLSAVAAPAPVVHARVLVLTLLVVAAAFGTQATANSIVLEGDDGQVQFGDTGSDPTIARVPNADAGGADHLAVRGAGGLVVEGPLSASLLNLNSTGGSLVANEITVNTLIVNGAAAAPASGSSACACEGVRPRLSLFTTGVSYNRFTAAPGITANPLWYNGWSIDEAQTDDPAGVFSRPDNQRVVVNRNGTYAMTLEHFTTGNNNDNRYVNVGLARGDTLLANAHCLILGTNQQHSTSCTVLLSAGTVLGLGGWRGAQADTSSFFQGSGGSNCQWTITLQSEKL